MLSYIDNCDLNELSGESDCNYIDLQASNSSPSNSSNGPKLLVNNILRHDQVPETDIISSVIPKIRINGTKYMGFGGTHQKLKIYRGSGDGTITQNADGSITAGPNPYLIGDFRCQRKFVKRKKRWLDINMEFDPDWNMSENTQSLVVFSIHHLKAEASFEATVKSGFKLEGDKFKPQAEVSGTTKLKITVGSAKFRANAELSRRQVLSTVIGPGITEKEIEFENVNFNMKRIGIIDYYFKHYHTNLTN